MAYAGRWERTADGGRRMATADGSVRHHLGASHFTPWIGTTLERAVRFGPDEFS
ncbi:hypothetical protein WKI65_42400 [Streptomyces sp. MS1.AVA.3]|uniref:hypothetical protein n=1 Tax=Streptomyces decoyicus TaxID=249567 RepID=UPI0030C01907